MSHRRISALSIILAILVAVMLPLSASARPLSACKHVPPVHHRMHGAGPTRQGDGLENTIAGMKATYETGVRWFETDLQQLRDRRGRRGKGRLVMFHDYTLHRTTPETGVLRNRTYRELPRTDAGQRIPTLGRTFKWISRHDGTHLLIEIKMMLEWGKVVKLLKRYHFAHTHRIMFDLGGAGTSEPKHNVALGMKKRLHPYVVTGLKRWDPTRRPATWVAWFGGQVRLDLDQGPEHWRDLQKAGVKYRFAKVLNGTKKVLARVQWAEAIRNGGFTHIITERSKRYLDWCADQQ